MGWVDPRVGSGRVGSRFCSFPWVGLGWSNMTKVFLFSFFHDYTTYNCKGPCKLNTTGYEKLTFSTNLSLYIENSTRCGHSYSFAVSCIGFGWVGSGYRKWTHAQLCLRLRAEGWSQKTRLHRLHDSDPTIISFDSIPTLYTDGQTLISMSRSSIAEGGGQKVAKNCSIYARKNVL